MAPQDGEQQQEQQQQPSLPPFHLAFPVRDVEEARAFYGGVLGCPEGRSAATWVDFNLFGHQIVAHLVRGYSASSVQNAVDGDAVPVPHFGAALPVDQFRALAARLAAARVEFEIEPHLRFEGKPGEQWTMFFRDPSGNALEFKAMTNPANLFAKYRVD
ncbi:glyoxalase [Raphidocelis subcapitata]|uniref:Glyoxalase n=1 Tax=Raphidocelis subcapitata TaxID=307507 RepID=A0A2V0PAV3_9CHLO|nr:glyoxalase [Raphidocelis subcapitata]|eukprot:GBF96072.1 glyoxalase [Raphidocelis subcapitata]